METIKLKNSFLDTEDIVFKKDETIISILPIPYDETSTWIKGSNKGPQAIIDASKALELYDIETDFEVYKKGIFTENFITEKSSTKKMVKTVENKVNKLLDKNRFPVLIGGEHSVSIGSIYSFANHFDDLTILQFDAHSDLRDIYLNNKFNHACVMARAKDVANIVQVGIRSQDISEKKNIIKENIFYAKDILISKNYNWIDNIISKLTKNVYITIDLDGFDPSILPSTGTPEPGGFLWYDALKLFKKVFDEKNVVGFDVVELCPNENNKASDFIAAKLIYKLLSYKFYKS